MTKFISTALAAGLLLAAPSYAQTEKVSVEEANEGLERDDPNFLRCKRMKVIGSLTKRKEVCMTNREWEEARVRGRSGARAIVDSGMPGALPGSN
ncbi:hypothetical protein B5C34_07480 [Pacificimonas flava]|uniref:Uncharacterized protein n=2 Tax=Pacificimonas TaxID=1960290 RepID=A0A219B4J7_9SPHN|nr:MULTISPECIES: hypothetical protein [Pacificimonas]MBZ6379499.1 hypothetical protein [Pacificimonas aurantium]OWV33312.1 hypothetical protein B5C34_07480 [Pacificimonas flava]